MSKKLDWRGGYSLACWVMVAALCMGILFGYSAWRNDMRITVYAQNIIRERAEGNRLMWKGMLPEQIYEKTIVFDARFSQADEKIMLSLIEQINEAFMNTDIMVYYVNGSVRTPEEIQTLTEHAEADLFIALSVDADKKDASVFGTKCYYNDVFFIPGYGNVEMADALLQNVVSGISGKAIGIFPCDEKSILRKIEIPAAELVVGYQTNEAEGAMLLKEGYQKQIAASIKTAVEAYYAGE